MGAPDWVPQTKGSEVDPRFMRTQKGSAPFGKSTTLFLFPTVYKSVDLIRSTWKRSVLIVQPLQFHDKMLLQS
jgi:hypothetical protein